VDSIVVVAVVDSPADVASKSSNPTPTPLPSPSATAAAAAAASTPNERSSAVVSAVVETADTELAADIVDDATVAWLMLNADEWIVSLRWLKRDNSERYEP
jgi:hypothetical protein